MKQLLITVFLLTSTIFCTSCRKNAEPVKGDWRWIYSTSGGFIGSIIRPADGTIVSMSLNNDSTYIAYLNNRQLLNGYYTITSAGGTSTIRFDKPISIDKMFVSEEETIYESNDTLFLVNNFIEASPSSVFVKAQR
jgi:hypothetical protein